MALEEKGHQGEEGLGDPELRRQGLKGQWEPPAALCRGSADLDEMCVVAAGSWFGAAEDLSFPGSGTVCSTRDILAPAVGAAAAVLNQYTRAGSGWLLAPERLASGAGAQAGAWTAVPLSSGIDRRVGLTLLRNCSRRIRGDCAAEYVMLSSDGQSSTGKDLAENFGHKCVLLFIETKGSQPCVHGCVFRTVTDRKQLQSVLKNVRRCVRLIQPSERATTRCPWPPLDQIIQRQGEILRKRDKMPVQARPYIHTGT